MASTWRKYKCARVPTLFPATASPPPHFTLAPSKLPSLFALLSFPSLHPLAMRLRVALCGLLALLALGTVLAQSIDENAAAQGDSSDVSFSGYYGGGYSYDGQTQRERERERERNAWCAALHRAARLLNLR